ncbi:unnamed protein product [Didymodactylos carnosus]|uniref:EF-hand domain-containing protein n=1 Tax=Didymodactylos carnosus TaxID=1234261 RepID=A0A814P1Q4_9BILA|nr:unnamed protein product [Didymodactylos carnosus]CAF1101550.1 unnamed protein product [Didymodactylos carnosus]CAF3859485.1 unnamed protein product [Didymodactylos carnosus]CAF3866421.1 unnamed protein product [Didymodactylos carnosus]
MMMDEKRHVRIREHVHKHDGVINQIEFQFTEDSSGDDKLERYYSLWLTRDHYNKAIRHFRQLDPLTFQEYIDTLRPLIAGHCCQENELRRAFAIIDENRSGAIEVQELYNFVGIIGRSTTEEKLLQFIERVSQVPGQMDYNEFKHFVRLGHGREMLVHISMEQ